MLQRAVANVRAMVRQFRKSRNYWHCYYCCTPSRGYFEEGRFIAEGATREEAKQDATCWIRDSASFGGTYSYTLHRVGIFWRLLDAVRA